MIGFLSRLFETLDRAKFERVFAAGRDPYRYGALDFERRRFDLMMGLISDRRWPRAFEAGCAEGLLTERLAPLTDDLVALDISQAALDRTRARLGGRFPWVRLERASLAGWRPAGPLDLAVVSEVLYYLGERNTLLHALGEDRRRLSACLGRLAGALAPGGRILLAHSYGPGLRARREAYRRLLEAMGLRLRSETEVPPTGEAGTDSCLLSLLEKP